MASAMPLTMLLMRPTTLLTKVPPSLMVPSMMPAPSPTMLRVTLLMPLTTV